MKERRKQFFFEKKNQKTLSVGASRRHPNLGMPVAPEGSPQWPNFARSAREKFFGSFFQKRTFFIS
jgi:hypothetical protein